MEKFDETNTDGEEGEYAGYLIFQENVVQVQENEEAAFEDNVAGLEEIENGEIEAEIGQAENGENDGENGEANEPWPLYRDSGFRKYRGQGNK